MATPCLIWVWHRPATKKYKYTVQSRQRRLWLQGLQVSRYIRWKNRKIRESCSHKDAIVVPWHMSAEEVRTDIALLLYMMVRSPSFAPVEQKWCSALTRFFFRGFYGGLCRTSFMNVSQSMIIILGAFLYFLMFTYFSWNVSSNHSCSVLIA